MLGNIYAKDPKEWATAEKFLRRALEIAPGDPWALNGLATIAGQRGQADEAVRLFQQAIAARTGTPAELLPPDHPAWDDIIFTMAHALKNLACVLSPRRIILGGSVRKAGLLGEAVFFERLRTSFREALAGYISSPALSELGIASYIVPPELGDDAGVCGALALAQDAAKETAPS